MKGRTGQNAIERKLELIEQIRSESQSNRARMQGRENILHGKRAERVFAEPAAEAEPAGEAAGVFRSLKLRALAACLLFAFFVAWDNGYYPALPLPAQSLYQMIGEDQFSAHLAALSGLFPDTGTQ